MTADNRTPRDLETRETFQRQAQWAPAALLPEITFSFVGNTGFSYGLTSCICC